MSVQKKWYIILDNLESIEEGKIYLDEETRSDFQLMRALDLLKGWKIFQGMKAA